MKMRHLIITIILILNTLFRTDEACTVPSGYRGEYFSRERGIDTNTIITDTMLRVEEGFQGACVDIHTFNDTIDSDGNADSLILFHDQITNCYKCYHFYHRTLNILQYKQSTCSTQNTLQRVCSEIQPNTDIITFFRKNVLKVNCKNTFEGIFHFTYEIDQGGGSKCNSPHSRITACQEPGSPYKDNEVFDMFFGRCDNVANSVNQKTQFQCLGSWTDSSGNVWSGISDVGLESTYRERYRCLLTRTDQEYEDNIRRFSMSNWAECSTLKSPYDGPIRLELTPVVGRFHMTQARPTCNFPGNYSGIWYHHGEYDVDVKINASHIYFKTQLNQFTYKEAYFICVMKSSSRYLTMAITVGKCEIDYVCFDMLPRHHSIIRWRMGRPYRKSQIVGTAMNDEMFMFRQACAWPAFTLDRADYHFNYKTFLLNPPVPIACPVRGRYQFTQRGAASELYRTRIRGMTERPRHHIDCLQYVSEFKACESDPTKFLVDASYCETVDHTGRPIGEYDEPDHQITCVGHWDEDWKSYMVTYDPEDPTSFFRCWIYERTDWRFIKMSRSSGASCIPEQRSTSYDVTEGASLALELEESERLFDDCPQQYLRGDPLRDDTSSETRGLRGFSYINNGVNILHPGRRDVTLITLMLLILMSHLLHQYYLS